MVGLFIHSFIQRLCTDSHVLVSVQCRGLGGGGSGSGSSDFLSTHYVLALGLVLGSGG